MRKEFLTWLGSEFVSLSSEAKPGADATQETREIFGRFQDELHQTGLSLNNTVRTRLWGRDRESRDQARKIQDIIRQSEIRKFQLLCTNAFRIRRPRGAGPFGNAAFAYGNREGS